MSKPVNERARVCAHEQVGPGLYVITLASPQIANTVMPGQFVHMRLPAMDDHLLRRPFSIYACNKEAGTVEILYQVVGFGTDHLTTLGLGAEAELLGPLGRPWKPPAEARRVLLVAGGVGAAPLFLLAEKCLGEGKEVDVVLGAQTVDALVSQARYEALLSESPRCSTNDGTFGFKGFCTPLVQNTLDEANMKGQPYDYLAVCGPEPLMKLVVTMAAPYAIPCEVSLERRMACGIGACLSCVVETVGGKRRSCVDGPVFDATEVIW